IDDGKESEAEARHEERDSHRGAAGTAREGEGGEPNVDSSSPRDTLEQPKPGDEQACGRDGDDERHEAREKEEQRAGAATPAERLRVGVSPGEGEDDGEKRSERRGVERREAAPSERDPGDGEHDDEDERSGES